jgi:DNA repair exonuclease SbcCD nuclease subunit
VKVLCTGDLHLNERSWLGGEWLDKQADVWQRIVTLAVEEDVDALLFAGDAFEHRRPTPREMRVFQEPLADLEANGIPAVAILGNHDREDGERPTALEVVTWESCMTTFSRPGVWERPDFSVACLPWTPVSRLVAAAEGAARDDVHAAAAELLVEAAAELRAESDILLAHWSVAGFALPNGLPVEALRETVIDLGALQQQHWKAVVLGHIHAPRLLTDLGHTERYFYVGSPMALNFGEGDTEHVVWIMDGDEMRSIPMEWPRFLTYDELGPGESWPTAEEGDVVRIRFAGPEAEILRDTCLAVGARVIMQPPIVRVQVPRITTLDERVSEIEALEMWAKAEDASDEETAAMVSETEDYLRELA